MSNLKGCRSLPTTEIVFPHRGLHENIKIETKNLWSPANFNMVDNDTTACSFYPHLPIPSSNDYSSSRLLTEASLDTTFAHRDFDVWCEEKTSPHRNAKFPVFGNTMITTGPAQAGALNAVVKLQSPSNASLGFNTLLHAVVKVDMKVDVNALEFTPATEETVTRAFWKQTRAPAKNEAEEESVSKRPRCVSPCTSEACSPVSPTPYLPFSFSLPPSSLLSLPSSPPPPPPPPANTTNAAKEREEHVLTPATTTWRDVISETWVKGFVKALPHTSQGDTACKEWARSLNPQSSTLNPQPSTLNPKP